MKNVSQHVNEIIIHKLRQHKLRTRLIASFLLVALLPVTIMIIASNTSFYKQTIKVEQDSAEVITQTLEIQVENLLNSYISKINTISSDMGMIQLIRNYLKADAVNSHTYEYQLMSHLVSETNGMNGFMSIELRNTKGERMMALPYSVVTEEIFNGIVNSEKKYGTWLGKYKWSELYPEAPKSKAEKDVIIAARSIIDYANTKCIAYIFISLDCDAITKILQNSNGMIAFVSDANANPVAYTGCSEEETTELALVAHTSKDNPHYLIISRELNKSEYTISLAVKYADLFATLNNTMETLILSAVVILACMILLSLLVTQSIVSPMKDLSSVMLRVGNGDFSVRVNNKEKDEIGQLCDTFDDMTNRISELTDRLYVSEINEKDAKLNALQAQINPHFLYNTLDMLSWMGYDSGRNDICDIVQSLSSFFRIGLSGGADMIPLGDELKHVNSYITIQSYRLKKVVFTIDVPEELKSVPVPKLILQPLVENALQHGLQPLNYTGSIHLKAKQENNCLILTISDNGVGLKANNDHNQFEETHGYGLKNIKDRISLLYGTDYGVKLESNEEGGVTASIILPIKQE